MGALISVVPCLRDDEARPDAIVRLAAWLEVPDAATLERKELIEAIADRVRWPKQKGSR
jgi:hypothetical protein